MHDADVLILGGGCAGLSLAMALAERAPSLRVLTLETREHYRRDRTWCFWDILHHSFSAAVTYRWQSWRVRYGGIEARHRSGLYSYQHMPADRFYQLATESIERAGQQLLMKTDVLSVAGDSRSCSVETTRGRLRSRRVFDSRPRTAGSPPRLEQRFTGWHVCTEQPCFDPDVVDLMDFQIVRDQGRTMFFYVLPFSATEALVEATFLDCPTLSPADAETLLSRYMERRTSRRYQVVYRESAVLPMDEQYQPGDSSSPVVEIGIRGGRAKASSGYAFQRIQRQSIAFADALARQKPLPRRIEPRFYSVLDSIFLRALRRHPDRSPDYFLALFRKLPPDTLVRFLSETATPLEALRVMLALPKCDFLHVAGTARQKGSPV